MYSVDTDTKLIEGYLQLLRNLSLNNKLELISRLTLSAQKDIAQPATDFFNSFGAWDTTQSAEEIITSINSSRMFNRQTETL